MIYITHNNGIIEVVSIEFFQGSTQYQIDERIKFDVLDNAQDYKIENDKIVSISNEVQL